MIKEFIGRGSVQALFDHIRLKNHSDIFIVTGKKPFQNTGIKELLTSYFSTTKCHFFTDFSVDPKWMDMKKGIAAFQQSKAGAIMAIGGGSVMDMGKLIKAGSVHKENFMDIVLKGKPLTNPGVPLYIVPTTAGSGSEATHFAVIYIEGKKYSLAHPFIYANAVAVDSEMTASMPLALRAQTAFDALSQATESYWSCGATTDSRVHAKKAMQLILPNMVAAVNQPNDENRGAMMEAAHLAGKAIDISKTTLAHALSYHLTSEYSIPHGHAVALCLGKCFTLHGNAESLSPLYTKNSFQKIMEDIYKLYGCKNAKECEEKWYRLMDACHLERSLLKIGLNTKELQGVFSKSANPERLSNNPVKVMPRDILTMYDFSY